MARLIFDQPDRVGAWVARQVDQQDSWGSFYAMGVERDGELVAGVVVHMYNGANATCHIAITRPGKYIIELFQHVCAYAFSHCGLKRLTGMVPVSKPEVIAFDKHLGFEEEFVMRAAAPDGGDLQVLVLWPDNCRWLRKE